MKQTTAQYHEQTGQLSYCDHTLALSTCLQAYPNTTLASAVLVSGKSQPSSEVLFFMRLLNLPLVRLSAVLAKQLIKKGYIVISEADPTAQIRYRNHIMSHLTAEHLQSLRYQLGRTATLYILEHISFRTLEGVFEGLHRLDFNRYCPCLTPFFSPEAMEALRQLPDQPSTIEEGDGKVTEDTDGKIVSAIFQLKMFDLHQLNPTLRHAFLKLKGNKNRHTVLRLFLAINQQLLVQGKAISPMPPAVFHELLPLIEEGMKHTEENHS